MIVVTESFCGINFEVTAIIKTPPLAGKSSACGPIAMVIQNN